MDPPSFCFVNRATVALFSLSLFSSSSTLALSPHYLTAPFYHRTHQHPTFATLAFRDRPHDIHSTLASPVFCFSVHYPFHPLRIGASRRASTPAIPSHPIPLRHQQHPFIDKLFLLDLPSLHLISGPATFYALIPPSPVFLPPFFQFLGSFVLTFLQSLSRSFSTLGPVFQSV
jgi:hypothetical protein